jgi:secretion/DNA translocation related TadE-like protein
MSQRGSAAVLLVGVAGAVLVLAAALGAVGRYLDARVRASAAADSAALAAAPVTFMPFGAEGSPRDEAARFARLNGADLVSCTCPIDRSWEARTVRVDVAVEVTIWPFGRVTVRADSRAEFVPALLLDPRLRHGSHPAATFRSS